MTSPTWLTSLEHGTVTETTFCSNTVSTSLNGRDLVSQIVRHRDIPLGDFTSPFRSLENRGARAMLFLVDVNQLLHHQRSAHLAMMPKGETLLSAGCAGLWYLDWIERFYGSVKTHIGLEYYSPRPARLPANVQWIENTVGDMNGVQDHTVDVLFSGQNIEHLWLNEMEGFLIEAARVIKPGGTLVIDSPNRTHTERLRWSHPEHTVELTVAEATRALELAGFEPTKTVGLWLMQNEDQLYSFEPADEEEMVIRCVQAADRPFDSFVWWIEANRVGEPDRKQLRAHLLDVFERAWPERLQRFSVLDATTLPGSGDLVGEIGHSNVVMFGPYAPLPSGQYAATFAVTGVERSVEVMGAVDVMAADEVLSTMPIPALQAGEQKSLRLEFALLEPMNFGVQFRVLSSGTARFRTTPHVDLADLSEPTLGPTYARSHDSQE